MDETDAAYVSAATLNLAGTIPDTVNAVTTGFTICDLNGVTWYNEGNELTGSSTVSVTGTGIIISAELNDASKEITLKTASGTINASVTIYDPTLWDGTMPSANAAYTFSGGSGTSGNPYLISTAADLAQLSANVNGGTDYNGVYFKMTADIKLNPGTFNGDSYTPAASESAAQWTAIGSNTNPFKGNFDGDGHAVSGIYIYKTFTAVSDSYQGLFGYVSGGTIENVEVSNGHIRACSYVGGVAGYLENSNLLYCANSVTLICGRGEGLYLGGVAGYNTTNSRIAYCNNSGAIMSLGRYVGGITGYNAVGSTVEYCYNTADITCYNLGSYYVAGIAGYNLTNSTVAYCYNLGAIESLGYYHGGVVGRSYADGAGGGSGTMVEYCYNAGIVKGSYGSQSSYIGGVVGSNESNNNTATVRYCYNTGSGISGYAHLGSLIGENSGTVSACYYDNWTFADGLYPRLADNGGYDMDETDAAYVSAAPVFLYDNSAVTANDFETRASVSKDFTVSTDNNVNWTSGDLSLLNIDDDDAVIIRSSANGVNLTASLNGIEKAVIIDSLSRYNSVSYILNGGSGTLPTQNDVLEDGTFTVASDGGFSKTDYAFYRWSDGTNNYAANSTYTVGITDVALTAIWKANAPLAPTLNSRTSTSITVTAVAGQEYSIDNGATWQSGNIFSGLNANTAYSIVSRVAATGSDLASDAGPSLSLTTNSGGGGSGSSAASYTITVTANKGGTISPTSAKVTKGASQTFTITAEEGYAISDVLVDGKSVGIVSRYTFSDVQEAHTIKAVFAKEEANAEDSNLDNHFEDVGEADWFYSAVEYIIEKGLMNGTGETTFEPALPTTRGMIVTVLWRLENQPQVSALISFNDVANGEYFTEAVAWAEGNGIVKGYDADTYGPLNYITREQLAAILYRYAQQKGYDMSVGEEINILSYPDAFEISEYAIPAIQWACGTCLMEGRDNGTLDPKGKATRAEVAIILQRFIINILK